MCIRDSLRATLETTLENALGEGVKASEEPALQVKLRLPESETSYGFCDFASHAAGSMALASLTGSTDGGLLELHHSKEDSPLKDAIVYLHWAQPLQTNLEEKNVVESNGFKFERRHFPADSRSDCWFCLASKDCEKHLIVGVYDSFYAAMPKGPVHPGHVLLVPVHHSSEGALHDHQLSKDLDLLKQNLREHAHKTYNSGLFVFERAIATKGGYHTHIQCVPIAHEVEGEIEAAMQQQLDHLGLSSHEVPPDSAPSALLGDDGQYFYAEIPTAAKEDCKRVLVLQSASKKVPLQFGREVIASVLQKPDLAHWKSCLTDKKQETTLATEFRTSFQQYLDSKDDPSTET